MTITSWSYSRIYISEYKQSNNQTIKQINKHTVTYHDLTFNRWIVSSLTVQYHKIWSYFTYFIPFPLFTHSPIFIALTYTSFIICDTHISKQLYSIIILSCRGRLENGRPINQIYSATHPYWLSYLFFLLGDIHQPCNWHTRRTLTRTFNHTLTL